MRVSLKSMTVRYSIINEQADSGLGNLIRDLQNLPIVKKKKNGIPLHYINNNNILSTPFGFNSN